RAGRRDALPRQLTPPLERGGSAGGGAGTTRVPPPGHPARDDAPSPGAHARHGARDPRQGQPADPDGGRPRRALGRGGAGVHRHGGERPRVLRGGGQGRGPLEGAPGLRRHRAPLPLPRLGGSRQARPRAHARRRAGERQPRARLRPLSEEGDDRRRQRRRPRRPRPRPRVGRPHDHGAPADSQAAAPGDATAAASRPPREAARATVRELLAARMEPAAADALADKLSRGGWTHDYPITAEEAKVLGLPVSTEVPEEIYEFMSLFPQPTRTRPSVEYVPIPCRVRQGREGG